MILVIPASHKLVQFMRQDEGQKKMGTTSGHVHAEPLTYDQCKKCKLLRNKIFFFFLIKLQVLEAFKNESSEVKAIKTCTFVQLFVSHTYICAQDCQDHALSLVEPHEVHLDNESLTAISLSETIQPIPCPQWSIHQIHVFLIERQSYHRGQRQILCTSLSR